MAEAAVEERPITRFFCHKCSVEFDTAASDYTCPHCSGGFIEELEVPPNQEDDLSDADVEGVGFRGFPQNQRLSNMWGDITDLLTIVGGQMDSPSPSPPSSGRYNMRQRTTDPTRRRRYAQQFPGHRIGRSRVTRVGGGTMRPSFENLITDVVLNLTGQGAWGGVPGSNQMFIVGNPADYAWGREGLDAIVTQLLNQMDGTGPPPMPKERIIEIPTVSVSEEQVIAKLQCSVCWEDFILGEPVRSLPCLHVYHEGCICPWLELHATCPICRKNLTEEAAEAAATNNSNNVSNGIAAFFRHQSQHINQLRQATREASLPTTANENFGEELSSINTNSTEDAGPSSSGSSTSWSTTEITPTPNSVGPSRQGHVTHSSNQRRNNTNDITAVYPDNIIDVGLDMDIDIDFD